MNKLNLINMVFPLFIFLGETLIDFKYLLSDLECEWHFYIYHENWDEVVSNVEVKFMQR